MSTSYTFTETITFTITHAKHLASKVATDLKRIQRFYDTPTDDQIADYETELILLIKDGYLANVTYGFRRDGAWIEPTLRYTAQELFDMASTDDDPGRIRPGALVTRASFYSYLEYNNTWHALASHEQHAFKKLLPFQRTGAPEPAVDGYLQVDRTYSAGGKSLQRAAVRSWQ